MAVSSQLLERRKTGLLWLAVVLEAVLQVPVAHGASTPTTNGCLEKASSEFPADLFTAQQRQNGAVVLHVLALLYALALMATVCQIYFVPALEVMADYFKVPTDVAGATFMAMATSAPELFSSVFGTFVAGGDIGVSTVLGSAVFNVVGVVGIIGLIVWRKAIPIDWFPVTRDCSMYGLTVLVLVIFVWDGNVQWWEALVMIVLFVLYLFFMSLRMSALNWQQKKVFPQDISERLHRVSVSKPDEATPLLKSSSHKSAKVEDRVDSATSSSLEDSVESKNCVSRHALDVILWHGSDRAVQSVESKDWLTVWSPPKGGTLKSAWWLFIWPGLFFMNFTIPDCRKSYYWFPVTFLLSIVWIGCLSYISVWMVTVISETFEIPDTVSGITLLAVGTSMPEAMSSIIVAKNGLGNMALCNLIGGNIFDVLFCLGAPWLVKAVLDSTNYEVVISSSGVTFSAGALLTTVVALYLLLVAFWWQLDFRIGVLCLLMYALYVVFACLYELKVLGDSGAWTCE